MTDHHTRAARREKRKLASKRRQSLRPLKRAEPESTAEQKRIASAQAKIANAEWEREFEDDPWGEGRIG